MRGIPGASVLELRRFLTVRARTLDPASLRAGGRQ
jgi:hypothetical protein